MDILSLISQIITLILLIFSWGYLKGLPDALHKRQEQLFHQKLSKEIELLKISQSNIQVKKIEQFSALAKLITDLLTNDDFKKKIEDGDKEAMNKLRESAVNLGIGLFFFASDDAVREYGDWKRLTAKEGTNPFELLSLLGRLMVRLRKDVGYEDTSLNAHDYLKMFITDYESIKDRISV